MGKEKEEMRLERRKPPGRGLRAGRRPQAKKKTSR